MNNIDEIYNNGYEDIVEMSKDQILDSDFAKNRDDRRRWRIIEDYYAHLGGELLRRGGDSREVYKMWYIVEDIGRNMGMIRGKK